MWKHNKADQKAPEEYLTKESKLIILFTTKHIRSRKFARICKASLFSGHKRVLREVKVIAEKLSEPFALVFAVEGPGKIPKPEPFLAGNSSEEQSEIEEIME